MPPLRQVTNSLNGLRVGLDLMFPEAGGGEVRKRAVTFHALRSEVQRLTEFTTELLIFSKGLEPRPVKLDVRAFVEKVIELTRERAADQGVALVVDNGVGPLAVRADPHLLHVVLVNLVGNALDAVAMSNDPTPRVVVRLGEGPHHAVAVHVEGAAVLLGQVRKWNHRSVLRLAGATCVMLSTTGECPQTNRSPEQKQTGRRAGAG